MCAPHLSTRKPQISRIIFINRYFHPDISATSQLLSDLAFALGKAGASVEVVTSRQTYGDARTELPPSEKLGNVSVSRVWTSRFGRGRLLGRAIDYLTFYVAAGWCLLRKVERGDVIVAKTDPPLISVVAAVVARLRGATLINWIQDLFPEVASAVGIRGLGPVAPVLRGLRDISLKAAHTNVVLGDRMAATLKARKICETRIGVIQNWADEVLISPVDKAANTLRESWGLSEKFVVGYSGNMGRAHDFRTIVDAAERLSEHAHIWFLFIGGGAQADVVRQAFARRNLTNVSFQQYQARSELALSLSVPDVHLVCLRPGLEGLIVPSKIYGIAAAGRTSIFVGAPDGEVAGLLTRGECGFAVDHGDAAALSRYIVRLAENPAENERLGSNARRMFEMELTKSQAIAKWKSVISGATRAAA